MTLIVSDYQFLIDHALKEDLGKEGDITSNAIFGQETGTAAVVAKQNGVLAGLEVARQVFLTLYSKCQFEEYVKDGQLFHRGDVLLKISGPFRMLLQAERTALNFLGRLSGIATKTHEFVKAVRDTDCRILDTRKTTPGWRKLEKYAVALGGGINHRMGLYDMVLIKDNHITAAGGITPAVRKVRSYLKNHNIPAKIEVEVTSLDELRETISLEVDQIMLDNMTLQEIRQAVDICNHRIPLEVSGNVKLDTLPDIAATGVDYISAGAITHSAPACDFSMRIIQD